MDRRRFLSLLAVLPFSAGLIAAQDQDDEGHGHGNGNGHGNQHGNGHGKGNNKGGGAYFRVQDYASLVNNYQGPRNLPPGLAKKYYRTGTLPPGWQKKMQPFPPALVQQLPPPPPNCGYGYVDGQAVLYDRTTRVILDSVDLISAFTGH
jgi:hypothetical protein